MEETKSGKFKGIILYKLQFRKYQNENVISNFETNFVSVDLRQTYRDLLSWVLPAPQRLKPQSPTELARVRNRNPKGGGVRTPVAQTDNRWCQVILSSGAGLVQLAFSEGLEGGGPR